MIDKINFHDVGNAVAALTNAAPPSSPVIYLYLDRLQSRIAPGRSHALAELPAAAAAE
jgi:hypothetical protein